MIKQTNKVHKIDALGRVTIPADLLRKLFVGTKNRYFQIYIDGQEIVLDKFTFRRCCICRDTENLGKFKGKLLCRDCYNELSQMNKIHYVRKLTDY